MFFLHTKLLGMEPGDEARVHALAGGILRMRHTARLQLEREKEIVEISCLLGHGRKVYTVHDHCQCCRMTMSV